jgi:hypothetical protein
MMLGAGIEKTPDHSLIPGAVLACLGIEQLDATPAQSKCHFNFIAAKDQIA